MGGYGILTCTDRCGFPAKKENIVFANTAIYQNNINMMHMGKFQIHPKGKYLSFEFVVDNIASLRIYPLHAKFTSLLNPPILQTSLYNAIIFEPIVRFSNCFEFRIY